MNDERTGSRDYYAHMEGKVEKMKYNLKVEESFVSQLAEVNKELEDENVARTVQDELVTTEHHTASGHSIIESSTSRVVADARLVNCFLTMLGSPCWA